MFISRKLKSPTELRKRQKRFPRNIIFLILIMLILIKNWEYRYSYCCNRSKTSHRQQISFPERKRNFGNRPFHSHNVDKNVKENENVTLIDVDELSKQIQETIQQEKKKFRKLKKSSRNDERFLEWEKRENWHPIFIISKQFLKIWNAMKCIIFTKK
jgi:hypothetical protein